jgi:hypothetical protein
MQNNVKAGHKNKQSYANTRTTGKEQYYTNADVVDMCLAEVAKHIDLTDRVIVEPCGGTGEFIKGFQRIGIADEQIISFDIEPKHELVQKGNYLEQDMSKHKNLVSITNPPFGRNSDLARQFFAHDAKNCDYICYLVPKSWRKWTIINGLDPNFHLIADIELPKNCFYLPDGSVKANDVLNTVFQIWERRESEREKIKIPDHKLVKKIATKKKKVTSHQKVKQKLFVEVNGVYKEFEEDVYRKVKVDRPDKIVGADVEMITFGHSCGECIDIDPAGAEARTTSIYLKVKNEEVRKALKEIDFSCYFNNVAYVQALSLQEINHALNEYFGLKNYKVGS